MEILNPITFLKQSVFCLYLLNFLFHFFTVLWLQLRCTSRSIHSMTVLEAVYWPYLWLVLPCFSPSQSCSSLWLPSSVRRDPSWTRGHGSYSRTSCTYAWPFWWLKSSGAAWQRFGYSRNGPTTRWPDVTSPSSDWWKPLSSVSGRSYLLCWWWCGFSSDPAARVRRNSETGQAVTQRDTWEAWPKPIGKKGEF